jgi:hypothetical protein
MNPQIFQNSGTTSKLYMQNGREETSFVGQPTNIKRYCTKFARIHQNQSNVALIMNMLTVFHTFHFQEYKFFTQKVYFTSVCFDFVLEQRN